MGPIATISLTTLACVASICIISLDVAIINSLNVMESFRTYFKLDNDLAGLNVSILYAGCVVSVLFTGPVLDRWGRRRGLMIGSALALLGGILQASAQEKIQLFFGRFFLGLSSIITVTGAPSLLMEIAPPRHREEITNTMIAFLPITGTVGSIIFLGIYDKPSNWAWRAGLMADIVGPVIALITLPFIPESIRWLISQNRTSEAFQVLLQVRNADPTDPVILAEFAQIKQTIDFEKQEEQGNSLKPLITPAPNLRRFLIAVSTNVFFQINGSNFLPYFFTLIVSASGVTEISTLLKINVGLTAWAAVCSISGILVISKLGRKLVFLSGTGVIALSFALLAILQNRMEVTGNLEFGKGSVAICFIFYWASFSSWMILNYSYPPEILKYSQRANGVAIGQAVGYLMGTGMTYAIPVAIAKLSWKYYVMNCLWNVPIFVLIWWLFPETKGKSLEEIDLLFEGLGPEARLEGIEGQPVPVKANDVDLKLTDSKRSHTDVPSAHNF